MQLTIHGEASVNGVSIRNGTIWANRVDEIVTEGPTAFEFESGLHDEVPETDLLTALSVVTDTTPTPLLDYIAVEIAGKNTAVWAEQRGVTEQRVKSNLSIIRSEMA